MSAPSAPSAAGAPSAAAAPGPPAVLVLEDGTTFRGTGFGCEGEVFGEAVFNTGMTGYQETLTDPSYCRQIVAMTAPHIGNTGVNDEDNESRRIWVAGFVIRDPSPVASNWRAARGLDDELRAAGITAIAITGTRALTLHLRERGAMRAAISTAGTDPRALAERVLASQPMTGADLAREVSTAEPYVVAPPPGQPVRFKVAAVDLGIKAATPAAMGALGCEVHVLPAAATSEEILALSPDGVFFSNGPGDPAACGYAVEATRGVLAAGVPVFGICLGSRCSAAPSGSARTSSGSATAAATSRSRSCEPAGSRSPATTMASPSPCPAGPPTPSPRHARCASIRPSARPRSRTSTSTTGWSRGSSCLTGRPSPCNTIRRLRPARTTPAACSPASAR
jgi:carbamoyl-phosphate synthase small subunit